jgi:hypothetical protein
MSSWSDLVQYESQVDVNANHANQPANMQPKTSYGRLDHVYLVHLAASEELHLQAPAEIVLAIIRECKLTQDDASLDGLDVHFYEKTGSMVAMDLNCVQAMIGRINLNSPNARRAQAQWAIIDRSGGLAQGDWRRIQDGMNLGDDNMNDDEEQY